MTRFSSNLPTSPGEQPAVSQTLHQSDKKLTEKEQFSLVRQLYLDPAFKGSFAGIKIMQREIFLQEHQHVPLIVVAKALRTIPTYLMHMKPIRKYPIATYDVFTIGENVQGKKLN